VIVCIKRKINRNLCKSSEY